MIYWAALSGLLSLGYAALINAYLRGWRALPENRLTRDFSPKSRITVLIPARNEADHIASCVQSILAGSYPSALLEVLVLDDFSADETAQIVGDKLQVARVIRLADHLPLEARLTPNKKKAIELGVAQAKGEIIVCTDSDCLAPKDWLIQLAAAFENPQTQMVCAPVVFHREQNLLQRFQSLDFLGLMGITGAGIQLGWHQMANGANLAYRKQAFETVGGYAGNEHLASGDDLFLAQKFSRRWPGSVVFLKNYSAAVQTEAMPDLRSFWQQRLRWGTKNAALPDWPLRLSLLMVFLFCWSIWGNVCLSIADAERGSITAYGYLLIFQIAVKAISDYLFLSEMGRFFHRKDLLRWFWPSFFLHTVYIAIIGLASLVFKKYTWKGRLAH